MADRYFIARRSDRFSSVTFLRLRWNAAARHLARNPGSDPIVLLMDEPFLP